MPVGVGEGEHGGLPWHRSLPERDLSVAPRHPEVEEFVTAEYLGRGGRLEHVTAGGIAQERLGVVGGSDDQFIGQLTINSGDLAHSHGGVMAGSDPYDRLSGTDHRDDHSAERIARIPSSRVVNHCLR